jgi:hypothetical protein
MSDEFVEVMLSKLMTALNPGAFDQLEEPTLNAALALIDSMQCPDSSAASALPSRVDRGGSDLQKGRTQGAGPQASRIEC